MALASFETKEQIAFHIMKELRQCDDYAAYMRKIGWRVERLPEKAYVYIRRLPLLPFSAMKVQRVKFAEINFEWLDEIANKHRVIRRYLELDELEEGEGVGEVDGTADGVG